MTTNATTPKPAPPQKIERQARLRWLKVKDLEVSPLAQRDMRPGWVDHLVANFDTERVGNPTVSERGGHFYLVDGQHRAEALTLAGHEDSGIQCWVYQGLNEQDEAEMFLALNDNLTVNAFDKFRVGVTAGRDDECDIDRIVRAQDLVISRDKIPGAVAAVGTLRRVYNRSGGPVLARALRIIRDSYGDAGLDAAVIDGIGLLCARYNGELQDEIAVVRLSKAHGGVHGLLNKAEVLRRSTGNAKSHCVAAAAVDIINAGRGGKKLPGWWREDAA